MAGARAASRIAAARPPERNFLMGLSPLTCGLPARTPLVLSSRRQQTRPPLHSLSPFSHRALDGDLGLAEDLAVVAAEDDEEPTGGPLQLDQRLPMHAAAR